MKLQYFSSLILENYIALSCISILLTTSGTLIITASINRWMQAINLSVTGLEASMKLLENNRCLEITGADVHREKGKCNYSMLNKVGISLIIIAMAIQLVIIHAQPASNNY